MKKQAERFGATFQLAHLNALDWARTHQAAHVVGEIHTRTLIVASGQRALAGLPSEQALIGHGVSSCATCDGSSSRQGDCVVGGGDSAMEEACF